jgi:TonB family protein
VVSTPGHLGRYLNLIPGKMNYARIILLTVSCLFGGLLLAQPEGMPDINAFVSVEQEARPLNLEEVKPQIGYPPAAVEVEAQGTVVARVLVNAEGEYVDHAIIKEVHPALDSAVAANLPNLAFDPALQNGKPVAFWVNLPFPFKLVNEAEYEARQLVDRLGEEIEKTPKDYTLWHRRGIQYTQLGRYEQALGDFGQSLALNPQKNKKKGEKNTLDYVFYAQFGQGVALSGQEKYEEALAAFDQALATQAESKYQDSAVQATLPGLYLERGLALSSLERYDEAKADYLKVISLDESRECNVYPLLADIGLIEDEPAELVKWYNGLIKCDPENDLLYYSRGVYRLEAEDYEGALLDFNVIAERTKIRPLKLAIFNRTAEALLGMERLQQAQVAVDQAMRINVLHAPNYLTQARIYQAQNKPEEMCQSLNRGISYGLEGPELEAAEALRQANCPEK